MLSYSFLPRVPISPSHANTACTFICGVTNAICFFIILNVDLHECDAISSWLYKSGLHRKMEMSV